MDLIKLKEIIEQTEAFQGNSECQKLVEYFEEFIALNELQKQGEVEEGFFSKLEQCLIGFWQSFDKAALSLGINPDELKANFNNPAFFTPEQWKNMEAFKQEIRGEAQAETSKSIKFKKNHKRVRI